ncbi:MAG: ABC-type transport auxiliary lipoprotein family protein [Thermodesulfobacteriota bacterium]
MSVEMMHGRDVVGGSSLVLRYAVVLLSGLVLVTGCSLKSRQLLTYHSFDYPSPEKEAKGPIKGTLMVYRLLSDSGIDGPSVMVTGPEGESGPLRSHRWEHSPADMITDLLLRDLRQAGIFQKTIDQSQDESYRFALEGTVQSLKGLVTKDQAFALLDAQFVLIDFEHPEFKSQELLKRTYQIKIPCKDTGNEAITEGFNLAVRELSRVLRRDIVLACGKPAEPRPDKPKKSTTGKPSPP